ncbi:hypothetical protein APHAL10511_000770 [Amanita phalloides]|nr:hypothetical protein APHAL10511_000770 [Amanita phalloides]
MSASSAPIIPATSEVPVTIAAPTKMKTVQEIIMSTIATLTPLTHELECAILWLSLIIKDLELSTIIESTTCLLSLLIAPVMEPIVLNALLPCMEFNEYKECYDASDIRLTKAGHDQDVVIKCEACMKARKLSLCVLDVSTPEDKCLRCKRN